MGKATAGYDLDRIKYQAPLAAEKRTIKVRNQEYGIESDFKNRTEFWGTKRSRDGGWLGAFNEENNLQLKDTDFEIEDVRDPGELKNVLHTCKVMIDKELEEAKAKNVKFFIGIQDDYRLKKSTLLEYKGNRKDLVKPIYIEEVTKYLIEKYCPTLVKGIETDDAVTMFAYGRKDRFVLSVDKDSYAQPTNVQSPLYPEEGIVDCTGFGKLWIEEKGKKKKIRGIGRKFLYWQILFGDPTDNYKANCFSKTKWGEMSAYQALEDCKDDKQAWETMIDCFKKLYPRRKTVTGWRGEDFKIDAYYVLNEMFQMARMLRWKDDEVHLKDVLNSLNIKYPKNSLI